MLETKVRTFWRLLPKLKRKIAVRLSFPRRDLLWKTTYFSSEPSNRGRIDQILKPVLAQKTVIVEKEILLRTEGDVKLDKGRRREKEKDLWQNPSSAKTEDGKDVVREKAEIEIKSVCQLLLSGECSAVFCSLLAVYYLQKCSAIFCRRIQCCFLQFVSC